jgi:general secretion pathway protein A
MYEAYWALKEKPFENTPDPRFLYSSYEHLEATNRLTYAIEERKGAALLTGAYGCGKTVISRLIFETLSPDQYEIALITNPLLGPVALLQEICFQLGINSPDNPTKPKLLRDLNERLYENMKKEKDTVIIIDEAQAIQDLKTFEELRLLLNFQLNNRFLLTLILIGQPELREKIDELKQLKQRLAIRFHLNPLGLNDTQKYVIHRLKIAGTEKKIFADDAYEAIWRNSQGVPRVINSICDMCLLSGFTKKLQKIDAKVVRKMVKELNP